MSGYSRETRERALRMRARGAMYKQITAELGVPKGTLSKWFTDPDGAKDRERKRSYGGQCVVCGAPTSGNDGPRKAAKYCAGHNPGARIIRERWLPRRQQLADLWLAGLTVPEIAQRMNLASDAVTKLAEQMRKAGWDLPYAWDRRPSSIAKREREATHGAS